MKSKIVFSAFAAMAFLVLASAFPVFAQGNSGSHGGGRPASAPGASRGMSSSRTNSAGRVDNGFGTASTRSNGRFDTAMTRARQPRYVNGVPTDHELVRFTGIAKKLNTTPEDLRTAFDLARKTNQDLRFGQFIAANVIADNLSATHPEITSGAILLGLENGHSIGKTLKQLGLSSDESKAVRKQAKKEIKNSKKRSSN